ncbi:hypothetical protein TNCV_2529031 [Trichonephila clavipes]|nr:hypothetical protein TNCV_2529031 [Trichonephila clavipes]
MKSELTLLGTCPILNCQYHVKLSSPRLAKWIDECPKQLEKKLANTHLAATENDGNATQSQVKKNNHSDGFASPTKVAKMQKVLQSYSYGAATPVNTNNKFQPLAGSEGRHSDASCPPKISPSILNSKVITT